MGKERGERQEYIEHTEREVKVIVIVSVEEE